jgi:Holliday junction resolvase RusA-like endonuclease
MSWNRKLEFKVNALPPRRTAQQKGVFVRNGRAHFYTKSAVRQQEQNTVALVLSHLPPDWEPLCGPLKLHLRFCFPYRKSEKKAVVRGGLEIPHFVRPDLDNLLKGFLDALTTAGCFTDDAQIFDLRVVKTWGPAPYFHVRLAQIGPSPVHPAFREFDDDYWDFRDSGNGCLNLE